MRKDPDRPSALDRTLAELSRLGAPLEATHGADTLHEAQAASAEAADDGDAEPAVAAADEVGDDNDATRQVSATEPATQDVADASEPAADEVGDATQAVSMQELLAETGESEAATDDDESARTVSIAQETPIPADEPDADSEATRQVPSLAETASDAVPELAETVSDAVPEPDSEPTRQVAAPADAVPVADSDSESTQQVPGIATNKPVADADSEPTQLVPGVAADDSHTATTRPVAIADVVAVAAADAIPTGSTHEIPSPDAASTQSLPQAPANPFVPPTQAAQAVPAPQPYVPPTQAAAAVPPGPGGPNPWLQQPQPQNSWQQGPPPQQPMPGAWGPGLGQPGQPGQPPFHPGQPGQPPYYPMQGPPPKKGNGGKTAVVIVGAVAAVAAIASLVVLATRTNGRGSSDNIGVAGNSSSRSAAASSVPTSVPGTGFPTDSATGSTSPSDSSSTAGGDVTDTASSSDSLTAPSAPGSTPFDPTSLNEQATDKTPLELNALVPQDFTDDKGVHYTLKAGSVQPCVQTDMSSNMQDILTSNSCSKEIAASFVDDSGQYLVSIKVLPLPDQHTATVVYNDLAQQSAADFGIWCPGSGPGSTTCQGDYQSATIKQYREQQHRYIILSVALAVNHSQSTDISPWLDAAAKKAVDSSGPGNWSGNQ
jgi:hypothetical protein